LAIDEARRLSRELEHRLRFLNAVQQSCGMGADVAVLDRNPEALRRVDAVLGNRVRTPFSTRDVVELRGPISSSPPFSCRAQPRRNWRKRGRR
jgi:hypothetical protein